MCWSGIGREVTEVAAASDGILKHVEEDGRNFLGPVAKAHSSGSTVKCSRLSHWKYSVDGSSRGTLGERPRDLAVMFHGC